MNQSTCNSCDKPAVPGKKKCQECLDKASKIQNAWRSKQIDAGLCEMCGKVPPKAGRSKCERCIRRWNDARNARRAERTQHGVCTEDGCGLPVVPGFVRCAKHHAVMQQSTLKTRQTRRDAGLCVRCGSVPHTLHSQQCEGCHLKSMSNELWGTRKRWQDLLDLFDSQRGRCRYTGWLLTIGLNASVDHIIPTSKGGTDDLANLQWVDLAINKMKLDHDEADFLAMIARLTERRAIPPASIDLTCDMDLTCDKPMVWKHT